MFLVKCRNVPSATHWSFAFWLVQFLLSVSDVQPDVFSIGIFPILFRWHRPPFHSPRRLYSPSRSLKKKKNHLACCSSFVSRENQQIIFSVLNKLLYFDIRELGGCAFFLSPWNSRAHVDWMTEELCIFSRRNYLECLCLGLLCEIGSWGQNAVTWRSQQPPAILKGGSVQGACFLVCLLSGWLLEKVKANKYSLSGLIDREFEFPN